MTEILHERPKASGVQSQELTPAHSFREVNINSPDVAYAFSFWTDTREITC